jgi:putative addiction module component (TIGR02574 family)
MSTKTTELLRQALAISVEERADLAGQLIESLDSPASGSSKAEWEAEIERRMAEIDSGAVKPVSMEEAFRQLDSTLERPPAIE